jgi:hypothetical protein
MLTASEPRPRVVCRRCRAGRWTSPGGLCQRCRDALVELRGLAAQTVDLRRSLASPRLSRQRRAWLERQLAEVSARQTLLSGSEEEKRDLLEPLRPVGTRGDRRA